MYVASSVLYIVTKFKMLSAFVGLEQHFSLLIESTIAINFADANT